MEVNRNDLTLRYKALYLWLPEILCVLVKALATGANTSFLDKKQATTMARLAKQKQLDSREDTAVVIGMEVVDRIISLHAYMPSQVLYSTIF